jgi:glyoxylase-like metal-dependent hydrolase (beta-lactamase superfamily II)
MKRRNFISAFGMGATAVSLSIPGRANQTTMKNVMENSVNAQVFNFTIGDIKCKVISDGRSQFPAYPFYAANAQKEEVEKAMRDAHFKGDLYTLQCNLFFLEAGDRKILIDTGAGSVLGTGLGNGLNVLANEGIKLSDITDILLTHAHLDHIGGLMDAYDQLSNATIHIAEKELAFWRQATPDLSSMPIPDDFKTRFVQTAHGVLLKSERIQTFKPGIVLPNIEAQAAFGHSPGHTVYRIESRGESIIHTGDIFHHQAFDLSHPHWATAFDQDAEQAHRVRLRTLDQIAEDNALVLSYHSPFQAIGYITKQGQRYRWEPRPWIS